MRFALELADLQLREGRHCILENPKPSRAWHEPEMRKFIEEKNVQEAHFNQCRFGLRSASGEFHRKSTIMVSSSPEVVASLHGVFCKRDHDHVPVIGGIRVTAHAGIYPTSLAKAIVKGIECQFENYSPKEVLAMTMEEEGDAEPMGGAFSLREESDDEELQILPEEKKMVIPLMGAYHQPMLGKTNEMLPNDFPSLCLATRLWKCC